ncbi:DUF2079 domain-containing protein [Streptomyces hoynatensis]|nr:DUF2079 domain-containing protein [Streptomyces hoynatensis]
MPRGDAYALAAGFFLVYVALSVTRYRAYGNLSWDLGIFEQVVRSYAHLRAPVADLKGPGYRALGDHFSPVTALIAPLYRLFPSPVTLLVVQAALFAVSVVPVTRCAGLFLGRAQGAAIGAAYGLSWGVQRAVDFDFHEICFAVPLLAFALEALLRERWWAALCWGLPLLLVKEDLGLTLAALALLVAARAARLGARRAAAAALAVAAGAVLACALITAVLIPAFNTSGHYDYWSKVSHEGGPLHTMASVAFAAADQKLRTLAWVLLPTTGLLALRSPLPLLALPTLAWRFLGDDPHYWGTDWHYSAVLMPVVFLALVDALPRGLRSPRPWLRGYARHLPLAVLAAALALSTTLPVAGLTHADTYRAGQAAAAGDRVLAAVPDGARVAANVRPIAHLTGRCRVFWIGDTTAGPGYPGHPDYVAYYDAAQTTSGLLAHAAALYPGTAWELLAAEDGFWVLRRR